MQLPWMSSVSFALLRREEQWHRTITPAGDSFKCAAPEAWSAGVNIALLDLLSAAANTQTTVWRPYAAAFQWHGHSTLISPTNRIRCPFLAAVRHCHQNKNQKLCRVCVYACVLACLHACVLACVCACVCVCAVSPNRRDQFCYKMLPSFYFQFLNFVSVVVCNGTGCTEQRRVF